MPQSPSLPPGYEDPNRATLSAIKGIILGAVGGVMAFWVMAFLSDMLLTYHPDPSERHMTGVITSVAVIAIIGAIFAGIRRRVVLAGAFVGVAMAMGFITFLRWALQGSHA